MSLKRKVCHCLLAHVHNTTGEGGISHFGEGRKLKLRFQGVQGDSVFGNDPWELTTVNLKHARSYWQHAGVLVPAASERDKVLEVDTIQPPLSSSSSSSSSLCLCVHTLCILLCFWKEASVSVPVLPAGGGGGSWHSIAATGNRHQQQHSAHPIGGNVWVLSLCSLPVVAGWSGACIVGSCDAWRPV